jgi:hypothetical protein
MQSATGKSAREIRFRVEMEMEENIARDMNPAEAWRSAYRKVGNPAAIRERFSA